MLGTVSEPGGLFNAILWVIPTTSKLQLLIDYTFFSHRDRSREGEMAVVSAVGLSIGTAMASGLLKSVLQKCGDAISKSDSAAGLMTAVVRSLKPQLMDLQRELTKLNALLCSADQSQHRGNDLVLLWIQSIRTAANFADHLLEDISYERLRRKAESNLAAKLLSGSSDGSLKFQIQMGGEIRKFVSMAAKIYEEAGKIGLSAVELVADPSRYQPPTAMSTDLREIRANVDTSVVVGRQADEDSVVAKLCRRNTDQVLRVIAICGMSGFEGVIQLPEWLGNLSSLKTLNIECCESMKQLPSSAAMQSLTQLTELNIIDCPLLEERCRKDKGEERHKISHIPRILIKQE